MDPQFQLPQSAEQKQQAKQQQEQKQAVLAHYLLPAARQRLERVFMVSPERAGRVEAVIFQLAQTGQIGPQSVDEDRIKQMLEQLSANDSKDNQVIMTRVDLDVREDLGDDDLSF